MCRHDFLRLINGWVIVVFHHLNPFDTLTQDGADDLTNRFDTRYLHA